MSAYTHHGVVYFAARGRHVKIGYTSKPVQHRLEQLRKNETIAPADLDLTQELHLIYLITDCVMRDERRLHGLFAAHRAAGEWFHLNDAFIDHLAGLRYVTYKQGLLNLRRAKAEIKRAQREVALAA